MFGLEPRKSILPNMIFLRISLFSIFVPVISGALGDPVDFFKRHRYEEASALWEKEIPKSPPYDEKSLRALKGLSMAYHLQGRLYQRLHEFSMALLEEYYAGVLSEAGSPLTLYYLGQVQFQAEKYGLAAASMEKAKKLGGGKVPESGDVFLAFARARQKKAEASISPKSIAAQWQVMDLMGALPSAIPAGLEADTPRARRCRLSILSRSPVPMIGEIGAAIRGVRQDAESPELSQDPGKNTQIDFYDPYLLESLSRAYLALAKWSQVLLSEEEKRFPDLAQRFNTNRGLAEDCLLLGQFQEGLNFLGEIDKSVDARMIRAKLLGKMGKIAEAKDLLEGVFKESAKNPAVIRDVAECYYFLSIDADRGLQLAALALKEKDGSTYYRVKAGLLMEKGQSSDALLEYGKGYKIEFRNRIDQIDPEYMLDYSFAIFLTNKMRYDEIVETMYHLQKAFPACRQMHYAMQGISAALARGYEVQTIFRKGG